MSKEKNPVILSERTLRIIEEIRGYNENFAIELESYLKSNDASINERTHNGNPFIWIVGREIVVYEKLKDTEKTGKVTHFIATMDDNGCEEICSFPSEREADEALETYKRVRHGIDLIQGRCRDYEGECEERLYKIFKVDTLI